MKATEGEVLREESGRKWYVNMVNVDGEKGVLHLISRASWGPTIEARVVNSEGIEAGVHIGPKVITFFNGCTLDRIGTGTYTPKDIKTGNLYSIYDAKLSRMAA